MAETANLIELLASFNTKERFYLMRQVLNGQSADNLGFIMSESFRQQMEQFVKFEIPPDAFMAMDYHLDWIHASLFLAGKDLEQAVFRNIDDQGNQIILGSPQDVDLLIAFRRHDTDYLILIEAKGYMKWGKQQLDAKVKRLDNIFRDYKTRYPNLELYVMVISPRVPSPTRTGIEHWPMWIQWNFAWLQLYVPPYLLRPTRCDSDGQRNKDAGFFAIELLRGNEEELHIPC